MFHTSQVVSQNSAINSSGDDHIVHWQGKWSFIGVLKDFHACTFHWDDRFIFQVLTRLLIVIIKHYMDMLQLTTTKYQATNCLLWRMCFSII